MEQSHIAGRHASTATALAVAGAATALEAGFNGAEGIRVRTAYHSDIENAARGHAREIRRRIEAEARDAGTDAAGAGVRQYDVKLDAVRCEVRDREIGMGGQASDERSVDVAIEIHAKRLANRRDRDQRCSRVGRVRHGACQNRKTCGATKSWGEQSHLRNPTFPTYPGLSSTDLSPMVY